MISNIKKSLTTVGLILISLSSIGQINDPEAIRMKNNAQNDLEKGNFQNAILLYNQAIKLEPNDVSLRRDLAYAHYLNGSYDQGKAIIDEVIKTDFADEQTYQISAAIEAKLKNLNKAKTIINNGLKKYPQSALLHHDKGSLLLAEKKNKQAQTSFEDGINADPNFPSNYFALAKLLETTQPLWSLLYYEMFINLEPNTTKTAEAKSNLYKGYIQYFQKTSNQNLPSFGTNIQAPKSTQLIDVISYIIDNNVAAIIGGINTESLTMLRTRVILNWHLNYAITTPHSLLSYHDKLIRNGYFDAYNQWLFGANENSSKFSTWIKSNQQIYSQFEKFIKVNPYQVNSFDPTSFKK